MVSKRRSIHSNLNFRPNNEHRQESSSSSSKGTKLTPEPYTIKEVISFVMLHCCKKSIFFDTNIKVAIYLASLFLISLIGDFIPFPKSYFSRTDNAINRYFVKWAWAWNLVLLLPFVFLSSLVNCCGNLKKIFRDHLSRIIIATIFWYSWTKIFSIVESNYGKCALRNIDPNSAFRKENYITRQACLKDGHYWHGFDISGHCFILIYGSLVLIEEAKAIIGWENIKEHLRNEDHYRNVKDTSVSTNPLRYLDKEELKFVRFFYEKFSTHVKCFFVAMTLLQVIWDVMLVTTILYYHIMVEKFLGGVIAIFTWYFTYRFWFTLPNILPALPGNGMFKYSDRTSSMNLNRSASYRNMASSSAPSTSQDKQMPKFMGMPIYATKSKDSNESDKLTPS